MDIFIPTLISNIDVIINEYYENMNAPMNIINAINDLEFKLEELECINKSLELKILNKEENVKYFQTKDVENDVFK